jgi:hypothetical protein
MTRYNKGNVILVPFPFSDQTTAKKRPAVIVTLILIKKGIFLSLKKCTD